jgi:AcrR family transcriptional regulator
MFCIAESLLVDKATQPLAAPHGHRSGDPASEPHSLAMADAACVQTATTSATARQRLRRRVGTAGSTRPARDLRKRRPARREALVAPTMVAVTTPPPTRSRSSAESRSAEHAHPPAPPQPAGGVSQRQHILDTALALMSQRGVDGTSMRDLAAATGLNVASLYHYFASKRELLVAVLQERGFIDDLAASTGPSIARDDFDGLADILDDILRSMLEVEDFIRLMLGEVMRGEETAHTVGVELFEATQTALERWLEESEPTVCDGPGAPAVARVLRAFIVGLFFEHLAGVMGGVENGNADFRSRAAEAAAVLRARL